MYIALGVNALKQYKYFDKMSSKKTLIFLLFFLAIGVNHVISNNNQLNDSIVTEKTYAYFCKRIMIKKDKDPITKIYFDGEANRKNTSAYDVADCLKEISLWDNIPILKQKELDAIDEVEEKRKTRPIKIDVDTSIFYEKDDANYILSINRPIIYKGNIYQEYIMSGNGEQHYISIIIEVDSQSLEVLNRYRRKEIHYSSFDTKQKTTITAK